MSETKVLSDAAQNEINQVVASTFLDDGPAKTAMDDACAKHGIWFGDIVTPELRLKGRAE